LRLPVSADGAGVVRRHASAGGPPEVDYVDQSASHLALTVIGDAIDMGQFTVLRDATLHAGPLAVRASIIGASHVVSFSGPGRTVTEVFACAGARSEAAAPLVIAPLPHLMNRDTCIVIGEVEYRFRARLGEPADVERLKAGSPRGQDGIGLAFTFPRRTRDEEPPETIVTVRRAASGLVAETVHGYRQEDCFVVTSSTCTWRRDA
jgi:hypothetical protein